MKDLNRKLSYKEVFIYWIPLVISGILGQCYGIINTLVVSKNLSSEAVAVMGACSPYKSLQGYIYAGITTGVGLVVCRTMQLKNWRLFKTTLIKSVGMIAALVVLALVCIPFITPLMNLIHVPASLQNAGWYYMLFIFLGSCAIAGKNLLVTILNGMAHMKFISVVSVLSLILECILAITFIAGMGTQVWGSACAVFITDLLSFIALLFYFLFKIREFKDTCRGEHQVEQEDVLSMREIIFAGCAKPIMMGLVAIGSLFYQDAFNQMSTEVISGMSYANTITVLFMDPLCSLALLAAAMFSQSVAIKEPDKRLEIVSENRGKLIKIAYVWSGISALCVMLYAPLFVEWLAEEDIAVEIVQLGAFYLRISIWGFVGLAYYLINRSALHAIGKNRYLPFFGLVEMLCAILAVKCMVPVWGFVALPVAVLVKWILPGVLSEAVMKGSKIVK